MPFCIKIITGKYHVSDAESIIRNLPVKNIIHFLPAKAGPADE